MQKFNELGFSFDEADEALINQEVETYWSDGKDSYEEAGVSKESIRLQVESRYRSRMIFNSIYGKGGQKEVSDADLKTYYAENYRRLSVFRCVHQRPGGRSYAKTERSCQRDDGRARDGEDFVSLLKETEKELLIAEGTAEADVPSRADDYYDYTISASTESYSPEALVSEVKEMEADEVKVVTTDDALILVKKLDPMADEESFEENRESILSQRKMRNF